MSFAFSIEYHRMTRSVDGNAFINVYLCRYFYLVAVIKSDDTTFVGMCNCPGQAVFYCGIGTVIGDCYGGIRRNLVFIGAYVNTFTADPGIACNIMGCYG